MTYMYMYNMLLYNHYNVYKNCNILYMYTNMTITHTEAVLVGPSDPWLPPAATAYADKESTLPPPPPLGKLEGVVLVSDDADTDWVGVRLSEFDLFDWLGVLQVVLLLGWELEFKGNDLGPGLRGDEGDGWEMERERGEGGCVIILY